MPVLHVRKNKIALLCLVALVLIHFSGFRIIGYTKLVENNPLANVEYIIGSDKEGNLLSKTDAFPPYNFILIKDIKSSHFFSEQIYKRRQVDPSKGIPLEISNEPNGTYRFFYKELQRNNKKLALFPDALSTKNKYVRAEITPKLVRSLDAIPSENCINDTRASSLEILVEFLDACKYFGSSDRYEAGDKVVEIAKRLAFTDVPTLRVYSKEKGFREKVYHHKAMWFLTAVAPEIGLSYIKDKLDGKIEEARSREPQYLDRVDVYAYSRILQKHSETIFLDYLNNIIEAYGFYCDGSQGDYAEQMLQYGDWRGIDRVMERVGNKIPSNQRHIKYFGIGIFDINSCSRNFRKILKTSLIEEGVDDDYNVERVHISEWYFTNRDRITYDPEKKEIIINKAGDGNSE